MFELKLRIFSNPKDLFSIVESDKVKKGIAWLIFELRFDSGLEEKLLNFINRVLSSDFYENEFAISDFCKIKVFRRYEKEVLYVFDPEHYKPNDEQMSDECYLFFPEDFKQIFLLWIEIKNEFLESPEKFKIRMLKNGARLVCIDNFKNMEDFNSKIMKIVAESPKGVIEVNTKAEAEELKKKAEKL